MKAKGEERIAGQRNRGSPEVEEGSAPTRHRPRCAGHRASWSGARALDKPGWFAALGRGAVHPRILTNKGRRFTEALTHMGPVLCLCGGRGEELGCCCVREDLSTPESTAMVLPMPGLEEQTEFCLPPTKASRLCPTLLFPDWVAVSRMEFGTRKSLFSSALL